MVISANGLAGDLRCWQANHVQVLKKTGNLICVILDMCAFLI